MKKLLFIALSALFCLGSAAQNTENELSVTDTVSNQVSKDLSDDQDPVMQVVEGLTPFNLSTDTIKQTAYPARKKGLFRKHRIEQALEITPAISKSKSGKSATDSKSNRTDNISDTGFGLDFGYSLIFVPSYEENGLLKPNQFGFAYNVGIGASFANSDRYGTLCNFMAKVGVETCHNRKMGIGADFLIGYGRATGDLFFFENAESSEPSSVNHYTLWGLKYGGQMWLKTGTFGSTNNVDILVFVRLIKAADPGCRGNVSNNATDLLREENWGFGVILRYRM